MQFHRSNALFVCAISVSRLLSNAVTEIDKSFKIYIYSIINVIMRNVHRRILTFTGCGQFEQLKPPTLHVSQACKYETMIFDPLPTEWHETKTGPFDDRFYLSKALTMYTYRR